MNDKYVDFSGEAEHSEIVDGVLGDVRSLWDKHTMAGIQVSYLKQSMVSHPLWKRFCLLVKSGLQLEGELENEVIGWAREYNQGKQGSVNVRTE